MHMEQGAGEVGGAEAEAEAQAKAGSWELALAGGLKDTPQYK